MVIWGNRYDVSMAGFRVGWIIWVHYNNKYVELLDTLWMLLRKKDQQVRLSFAVRPPDEYATTMHALHERND